MSCELELLQRYVHYKISQYIYYYLIALIPSSAKYISLVNINGLCERQRYVYTNQCTQNLSLGIYVASIQENLTHMQNYKKRGAFQQTGAANRNPR